MHTRHTFKNVEKFIFCWLNSDYYLFHNIFTVRPAKEGVKCAVHVTITNAFPNGSTDAWKYYKKQHVKSPALTLCDYLSSSLLNNKNEKM